MSEQHRVKATVVYKDRQGGIHTVTHRVKCCSCSLGLDLLERIIEDKEEEKGWTATSVHTAVCDEQDK